MKTVNFERSEARAILRFNRPHRLNAVTEEVYDDLGRALDDALGDPSIRTILLAGEGRAFCTGADLKEHAAGSRSESEKRDYARMEQQICLRLQTMDKPCIAVVHGYALGAGAEIALSCDFVVTTDDAQFGFPEMALGTFIGGGLTATLPLLVGLRRAKELVMLGRRFSGKEAEQWGLVYKSVPSDRLWAEADRLADELAAMAPVPVAMAKRQLRLNGRLPLEDVMEMESESLFVCMKTEDWAEGVRAFKEKRRPQFKGM